MLTSLCMYIRLYFSVNNTLNISSSFLNICNVVAIAILMFLSISSIICVFFVCQFQLIDLFFLLFMSYIFLILCTPGTFSFDVRYLNFTLLDVGYFCILNLCSEMWLNYLEKKKKLIKFFFYTYLDQTWVPFSWGLIFPYPWGKTFLSTLNNDSWILRFST